MFENTVCDQLSIGQETGLEFDQIGGENYFYQVRKSFIEVAFECGIYQYIFDSVEKLPRIENCDGNS